MAAIIRNGYAVIDLDSQEVIAEVTTKREAIHISVDLITAYNGAVNAGIRMIIDWEIILN